MLPTFPEKNVKKVLVILLLFGVTMGKRKKEM
jgi:hypothetical protein